MCRHLTFQALGQGLRSNVSAHLRVLNISGINSADGLPYANIEEPFFENLTHTALKVMDGSWTRIMYVKVSMEPLSKLKTFNVTGTMLIDDFYCLTSLVALPRLKTITIDYWSFLIREPISIQHISDSKYLF